MESGWKPIAIMVLYHVIYAWMNILMKLAAHDGMHLRVASSYRFLFGSVSMVPIAFFFERKTRPKLTWKVLLFAILSGLFGGALGQNLFLESLVVTSATFVSAMVNLVPAMTFLVAVCMRLESVRWNTKAGKAKVLGTIIGIGGAMLFTFYKGPNITIWKTNVNLLNILPSDHHHRTSPKTQEGSNQVLGTILALLCCISFSFWLIFQAKAAQYYPCPLSFTALMIVMGMILNFTATIFLQRDWSEWRLGWNIRLVTVSFSGILGTTVTYTLITLAIAMRGPLFVSAFSPLLLVIVAFVGSLVLEEDLSLGSMLGGCLVVCSLYIVCWGKSEEIKANDSRTVPNDEHFFDGDSISKEKDKGGSICLDEAAHDGMDLIVASTYRFSFGAVSMLPIAYFFEREMYVKLIAVSFVGYIRDNGIVYPNNSSNSYERSAFCLSCQPFATCDCGHRWIICSRRGFIVGKSSKEEIADDACGPVPAGASPPQDVIQLHAEDRHLKEDSIHFSSHPLVVKVKELQSDDQLESKQD
ncbi:OLC1v1035164C1 [Oldenlandia corymbosa var. corymbosa]|uniref:OLC1v1035164C1 n=1 Tax=Oldenlandia corymbosa var. corymbosa TaxID=529605 RepID=A0AAV1CVK6_OLDCO|nr:OLC1v1035164C1 [Oldenlandia corymbosa var. corymbosa]